MANSQHLITEQNLVKDFLTIRVCSNDRYWKKSIYGLRISNLITKTPVAPGDIQYPIMLNVKLHHRPHFLVCEQTDKAMVYTSHKINIQCQMSAIYYQNDKCASL